MLPKFRRYIVVNDTASTITAPTGAISLKETPWFIDPATGKITYGATTTDDFGFTGVDTLTSGQEIISPTEIDNTAGLYIGSQIQLEVTHDLDPAAGSFKIYLSQGSVTGELETDATGYSDAVSNNLLFVGADTWPDSAIAGNLVRSQVFPVGA